MDRQQLKQVVVEQHQTALPKEFFQREVLQQIAQFQDIPEVIAITGLRRCGKSTVLHTLRDKAEEKDYFINFEDDRLIHFTLSDFQELYELYIELYGVQKTFYFDEIQNIPHWERFVRRLRDNGNKVYITGSNAKMFSKELGTKLTGRHIEIEMFPYSFREIVQHENPNLLTGELDSTISKGSALQLFRNFRGTGGIPEYVKHRKDQYLHDLYESILYRDVIVRHKIANEKGMKELVLYLASNIGKEFSYKSLAKALGISSSTTIAEYSHHLESSFLCSIVNRYHHSLKAQMQSPKKCYMIDHALAKVIGFRPTEDLGRLLENIVYLQCRRTNQEIYYHKDKKECDFILRNQGRIQAAIQVSTSLKSSKTKDREISGLLEAMDLYSLNEGLILTENEEDQLEIKLNNNTFTIHILPVWKWLLTQ